MKSYVPAPPRVNPNMALAILTGALFLVAGTALTTTTWVRGGPAWFAVASYALDVLGAALLVGTILRARRVDRDPPRHTHRPSLAKTVYRARREFLRWLGNQRG